MPAFSSMPLHRSSTRKGITLIELAIVLAVMGLVLGALWAVVGTVWDNYKGFRARQEVISVVQNVRTYYMNRNKINCADGEDITSLLDSNDRRLIPIEMRRAPDTEGGAINHALANTDGGSFTVSCLDSGGTFRIKLKGLAQQDCMSFLMQFPVLIPEIGVKNVIQPGGTVSRVNLLNISDPVTGFPMTLTTALNWCNSTANEVGFDFKLRN